MVMGTRERAMNKTTNKSLPHVLEEKESKKIQYFILQELVKGRSKFKGPEREGVCWIWDERRDECDGKRTEDQHNEVKASLNFTGYTLSCPHFTDWETEAERGSTS
jgi:hypothetical protein